MRNRRNNLCIILLFLISLSITGVIGHGEEHTEHKIADHCQTPTEQLMVKSGTNDDLIYESKEYNVEKNTCYQLTFVNLSDLEHDVNIDAVDGSSGIKDVHLHMVNNTDGMHGNGTVSMNIQTPNADTEFRMYCTVPGHAAGGMVATLIVGEGLPEEEGFLPLNLITVFVALSLLIVIGKQRKFKFRN